MRLARLGRCALAGVLALLAGSRWAGEEKAAATEKKATKPQPSFSPEVEAKFTEFLGKLSEAKRKNWQERMKKEIADVTQVTGLGPDGVQKLEAAAAPAVDLCLQDCSAKMSVAFRSGMGQQSEEMLLGMFAQLSAQLDTYVKVDWFGDYVRPFDQPVWTEALTSTLTAGQSAAWQKEKTERWQKFRKEVGDRLKPSLERTRRQHEQEMAAKTAEIKLTLALPPERAAQLEALGKSVIAQTVEDWGQHAMKIIFSADEEQRRQMLSENFYLGTEENGLPSQQAAWKDGLARLLSPEELQQIQVTRDRHREKRKQALGQMLITLLDDKTALTEKQRQQLQPIAERAVQDQSTLFPVNGGAGYFNYPPQVFFAAAQSVAEEEIKPILAPVQWPHWRDACDEGILPNGRTGSAPPTPPAVSDDVEQSISDFLWEKSQQERKRVLTVNLLKVEDVTRVADVKASAVGRLQTAARGMTEQYVSSWNSFVEQNVRAQIQNITAENVNERLAGIDHYVFQRGERGDSKKPDLWEGTLRTELTEEQQKTWKKALEERSAYREKAITAVILSEFDRKNILTDEQAEKLAPLVAGFLKDYSEDIGSMFSPSNAMPWFLQSYSMFMPFAGLGEKDLKAILRPEQWEGWAGSEEFANCTGLWDNIRQHHEQRLQVTH